MLIKTPIYESTARVLIEKEEDKSPLNISLGFLGNSGPTNSSNTYLTQEFMLSREMLDDLNYSLEVKKHYQSKKVDLISRLKRKPSQKDFALQSESRKLLSYNKRRGAGAAERAGFENQ